MQNKPTTVSQHTNSVPRELNYVEEQKELLLQKANSTSKHFMGPSRCISMPLIKKVLAFMLEKCKNGLPITRDNMNEGTGSYYIPEDSTARFQSQ